MSSELELSRYGREALARAIEAEAYRPIWEPIRQVRHDLSYCAAKALANEQQRLRESGKVGVK